MFEILCVLIGLLVECFAAAFFADERPEAQRLTVGCGVIVLAMIGSFVIWVSWQRGIR